MEHFAKFGVNQVDQFKVEFFDAFRLGEDSVVEILKNKFGEMDEFFFFVAFYLFNKDNHLKTIQKEGLKKLYLSSSGKGSHRKMALVLNSLKREETELAKKDLEDLWRVLKRNADFLLSPKALFIIYCLYEVRAINLGEAQRLFQIIEDHWNLYLEINRNN